MPTIVHVTHEAVHKIGGIGTVLEGLVTSRQYDQAIDRTILLGPLFSRDGDINTRLGRDGEVLYSSLDGRHDHPVAGALRDVQNRFGVQIVYGRRHFQAIDTGLKTSPEVLLIDISRCDPGPLNQVKHRLYERYGLASDRFQDIWEYEQYVRLAGPGLAALQALGASGHGKECVIVAHEFMGMPTALAAMAFPEYGCHTVFYAHEVATVRKIVEEHPGHDSMFYNAMTRARRDGLYLEDVFGSQSHYFKHPLIKASRHCDTILAVGDYVIDELRFLDPAFDKVDINLTYNGIPAYRATANEEAASKRRLQDYAENLLGFRPDFIFTHVTRLVRSKGLWRDLEVMEHVDTALRKTGQSAVLFVLSTEIGGPRRPADIRRMEHEWRWPLAHREGLPDLSHGEAIYYAGVQAFNARARNCTVVFINQFGFDREHCGDRMAAEMEFWDIRKGSDVEFGQSVYEPFGIAQIEAMSFGCICVISRVCGCAGFVDKATQGNPDPNVIIADYTALDHPRETLAELLAISDDERDAIESRAAAEVGRRLVEHLPQTPQASAALLDRGHDIARRMSWDVIVERYFLPAIRHAMAKRRPSAT